MKRFRFKSIRARTLATILPFLILSLFLLSFMNYYYSQKSVNTEIEEKMDQQLNSNINYIDTLLIAHSKIPELLARAIETAGDDIRQDRSFAMIQEILSTNADTFGVGVWYEPYQYKNYLKFYSGYAYRSNGQILFSQDYNTDEYNYPSKDWYKNAKNTKETVLWSEPVYDETSEATILTTTAPFYTFDHKFRGVTTATIDLTHLQQKIAEIQVGKTGSAFLLDQQGVYIAGKDVKGKDRTNILKNSNASLASAGKQMLAQKHGVTFYKNNGDTNRIYYKTIPETSWILAMVIPEKELLAPINDLLIRSLIVIFIASIFVALVIYLYSRYITKNIQRVNQLSLEISNGDLTGTLQVDSSDEFGQMANNLNTMSANLRTIIEKVKHSSELVSETSDNLQVHVSQTAKSISETTRSIQDVAAGSEKEASLTEEANIYVREVLEGSSQLLAGIQSVKGASSSAVSASSRGSGDIDNALEQMKVIQKKSDGSVLIMHQLVEKSAQIDTIIDWIQTIAHKTKILSLNAGITASQAGTQGKALSVIAEEIRQLADNSAQAGQQIQDIVNDIQTSIDNAVGVLKEGNEAVGKGLNLAQKAGDSFNDISEAIVSVSSEVDETVQVIDRMETNIKLMAEGFRMIADISKKSAEASSMVSSATQEQGATIQEIEHTASVLASMSLELKNLASSFRL